MSLKVAGGLPNRISVDTGELLWTYEANLDQSINVICCGWTSRGLAMGDGKTV